ncbi:LD-carboxypeptidase LdcB, LAS superfamily [Fodinibius roseus]|uniref:LD-carboxypeptidase LdcB, LAS superfamily n=1 Tax=Fodinibius roseus TaxID=1194090 RepID=A0A1M5CBB7_9BACT|nr:M15 family metallopeptidase [Fodinibius roseus]SHF51887.1 LD-carboxypeptidase LdcB, LAS superfamily [Fodinibius roseus]
MRIILFLFLTLMISCSSDKSSSNDQQAQTVQAAEATNKDTLQVDTSIEFVTGQFDFETHDDFVRVDSQYADKEIYLHEKTYEAFKAMADSAKADGITFTLISGTRNFDYQKSIWDRKWNNSTADSDLDKALEILEYSSMPMTSRHHWGTDIDLNDLNNSYFESGQGRKEYEWLKAHANDFGFYQPYTDKSLNGRTGYNEEKWHWSYLPLASQYLKFYNQHISNADITGFKGSELAKEIDMVGNYVNGISSTIKKESR